MNDNGLKLSRKEREKIERKNSILNAAKKVFAQKGFEKATLDEIAEEAEFGKGTLYNYFKNNTISYYVLDDIRCVVVDCTAGIWGYPGYDAGVEGEKIAFEIITKDYTYLE